MTPFCASLTSGQETASPFGLEEFKAEKAVKEIKKSVKKFKIKEITIRADGVCADCRH